jgi:FkbM family methyltransferase
MKQKIIDLVEKSRILSSLKQNFFLNIKSDFKESKHFFFYFERSNKSTCLVLNFQNFQKHIIQMPNSSSFVLNEVFKDGQYIKYMGKTLEIISKRFDSNKEISVVDLGANFGIFPITFEIYSKESWKTNYTLFEPVPENVNYLKKNMEGNSIRHAIHEELASEESGEEKEIYYSDSLTGPTMEKEMDHAKNPKTTIKRMTKSVDDLDESNVALVKIDIEGSEEKALRGMKDMIKHEKPVIMTSYEHKTNDKNEIIDIVTTITKYNYEVDEENQFLYFFPAES